MRIQQLYAEWHTQNENTYEIECKVVLDNQKKASYIIPSSMLQDDIYKYPALTLEQSLETINTTVSFLFEGKEIDLELLDNTLEEVYAAHLSTLIFPTLIRGLSIACARAHALQEDMPLYEYVAHMSYNETITIPYPFFPVFSSAENSEDFIKKIWLLPIGAHNFRHAYEMYEKIKDELFITASNTSIHDNILHKLSALLLQHQLEDLFVIAIRGSGDQAYNQDTGLYRWADTFKTSEEILYFYKESIEKYKVFSIENGFAVKDVLGAATMLETYGKEIQLAVNEDINLENITAVPANAVILRLENFLTLTQFVSHITQLKGESINVIIEQTTLEKDMIVVDIAVGASAGQIKVAPYCNQTYLRLLEIEDDMTFSLLDFNL